MESLREVIPVLKGRTGIFYKRIKVEELNASNLRAWMISENCKQPNAVEFGDYLLYSYENHLPIYISKKDGRIYSPEPNKESSVDAFILLSILHKADMVENFKRWQHGRKG